MQNFFLPKEKKNEIKRGDNNKNKKIKKRSSSTAVMPCTEGR
jgi:hypothetical protein